MLVLLRSVESILSPESSETAFQVIDQSAWRVSISAICANARSERDVVVDWRFLLTGVREIRLLT